MRVFLTGATGFIGSALIPELLQNGHQVLGLTRSDAGAAALEALGAEVHRGSLEDPASLQRGAEQADGVIHCAFDHSGLGQDMAQFAAVGEKDRRNVVAMAEVLAGSNRPLIISSGVMFGSRGPGQIATEDYFDPNNINPRAASEAAIDAAAANGVRAAVVRLPQVHDTVKQGLITYMVAIARQAGVSAYVGEGVNRWSAAPIADVARLYRLVLEKGVAGARYHAVAEEGVPVREIAEALGRGLRVPTRSLKQDEAQAHFGGLGIFVGLDLSASSKLTRERLGWEPKGRGLLADLNDMQY
jgi:nucleoside-diphosphate-sugar epimerase